MYNSEFCMVDYLENENTVFLTWKKFCCGDNYRRPTTYALELLRKYKNSNYIVDARNGFEDEKEDVEWGFQELLPQMGKTDCKYIILIMNEVNDIEDEMDMWTKEFMKYFFVIRVTSYPGAIKELNRRIKRTYLNVTYTLKEGTREQFYLELIKKGIITKSREEAGNMKYQYFFPAEEENQIFLMETWENAISQEEHIKTPHYQELQFLKAEYVTNVEIEKYEM